MAEQSGISKIVLYENKSIKYYWTDSATIQSVITSGSTVTLEDCEMLNYEDIESIGANDTIMHDYSLMFRYYDLTLDTIGDIETLLNTYGWIPVIYFRNGETKILRTPVFLQEYEDIETNVSHSVNLTMKCNELTNENLLDFGAVTAYIITFSVTDGASAIDGATVTIDGNVKLTDSNGLAVFYLAADTYSYTVNKSGYVESTESPTISADVVIDVSLEVDPGFGFVTIGTQTWSDENLAIVYGVEGVDYKYPNNDINNVADYGLLYLISIMEAFAATIDGWRLPTKTEVETLNTYLGSSVAGGKLKETGLTYWNTPNTGATNSEGFNGRAGGINYPSGYAGFKNNMYIPTSTGVITNRTSFVLNNTVQTISESTRDYTGWYCNLRLIKE